ncbi:hypothetical protein GCM10025868_29550 [Angustibacter aerolatus]|uniref:Uncharacterized protein n=1 Tax=Angustibacter aerolatus TaxID=1162965 RepID=A0ABQ6JHJ6_9ACTN|nr:hypothetical protein GCM10025868_29550 [Angustibacter aerolatus]
MAPTRSLMPNWVTMRRARPVAFSMSFEAPVVGSWKTRLLRDAAAEGVGEPGRAGSLRVVEYLSSTGSTIV